jgi:hypothetical protein
VLAVHERHVTVAFVTGAPAAARRRHRLVLSLFAALTLFPGSLTADRELLGAGLGLARLGASACAARVGPRAGGRAAAGLDMKRVAVLMAACRAGALRGKRPAHVTPKP